MIDVRVQEYVVSVLKEVHQLVQNLDDALVPVPLLLDDQCGDLGQLVVHEVSPRVYIDLPLH